MKTLLILFALCIPAAAQNGHAPDVRPRGPSCASMSDVCSYAGTCSATTCPEPTIPKAWWVDQDDREARCYRYSSTLLFRDALVDRCVGIVRSHRD